MRKATDRSRVSNRYYRPEIQRCPYCGRTLKRRYTLWDKYIVTWEGSLHVYNVAYSCAHRKCRGAHELFVSHAANHLSLKGCGFSLDLVTRVGWWRFWECRTLDEILQQFQAKHLPIARRHILNLLNDFLALLCAAQPFKIEGQRQAFESDGIILSLDALQPEKGNDQWFVVRAWKQQLTLLAKNRASGRASEIQTHLLEPIRALGLPLRAVVSDADDNLRRAVAQVWPELPHQACQVHGLREAGRPIFEADRAFKTTLKKAIRTHLVRFRRHMQALDSDDPFRAVLNDYVTVLRIVLRTDGVLPLELGGLQVCTALAELAQSLRRCQKKSRIPCCVNSCN
jgi:hypothetical protein